MDNEQNERECKQIGDTSYTFLSDWVYHKEGVRKGCEQVFAKANDEEFVIWRNLQEEAYQRLKAEIDFYEEWKEKDRDALEHGLENIEGCLVDDEKKVCYLVTKRKEKRKTLKDRGLMCEKDVEAFFSCLKYVLKLGGEIQEAPEAYFCDGESWRARGVVRGKNAPSKMLKLVNCVQGSRHDKKRLISKLRVSKGSDELDESKLNEIEKDCLKIVSGSSNGGWRKIMVAIAIVLLVFASYFAILRMEFERAVGNGDYGKAAKILNSTWKSVFISDESKSQLSKKWCDHICEGFGSERNDDAERDYRVWTKLFGGGETYKSQREKLEGVKESKFNSLLEGRDYLGAAAIYRAHKADFISQTGKNKLANDWSKFICEGFLCDEPNRNERAEIEYQNWLELFKNSEQYKDQKEEIKKARNKFVEKKEKDEVNYNFLTLLNQKDFPKASEILETKGGLVSEENKVELEKKWREHIVKKYKEDRPVSDEEYKAWSRFATKNASHDSVEGVNTEKDSYEKRKERQRKISEFKILSDESKFSEAADSVYTLIEGEQLSDELNNEIKKFAQKWAVVITKGLHRQDEKKQYEKWVKIFAPNQRWQKAYGEDQELTDCYDRLKNEYIGVQRIRKTLGNPHLDSILCRDDVVKEIESTIVKGLKQEENKEAFIGQFILALKTAINKSLKEKKIPGSLPAYINFVENNRKQLPPEYKREDTEVLRDVESVLRDSIQKGDENAGGFLSTYYAAHPEGGFIDQDTFVKATPQIRNILLGEKDVRGWLTGIVSGYTEYMEKRDTKCSMNEELIKWMINNKNWFVENGQKDPSKEFSKALLTRVDFIVKTWKDKLNDKTENDPDELYEQMLQEVGQFIAPLGLKGVMDSAKNCLDAWRWERDERWCEYRYIWEEKAKEVGWLKEDGTMFEEEDRTIYYLSVKMIRKNQQKDSPKYEATITHSSMDLENKENTEELKVEEDEESEPFWCDFWGTNSTTIEWHLLKPGSWKTLWFSEKEQKGEKVLSEKKVRSAEPIKLDGVDEEIMIQFIENQPELITTPKT